MSILSALAWGPARGGRALASASSALLAPAARRSAAMAAGRSWRIASEVVQRGAVVLDADLDLGDLPSRAATLAWSAAGAASSSAVLARTSTETSSTRPPASATSGPGVDSASSRSAVLALDGDLRGGGARPPSCGRCASALGQVGVERADVAADANLGVVQVELRLRISLRDVECGSRSVDDAADRQLYRGALAVGA